METRSIIRVADVHARTFANRIEPLQHLDAVLAVLLGGRGFLERLSVHFLAFSADGKSVVFYSTNCAKKRKKSAEFDAKKSLFFSILDVAVCPS
jgi:hypothetical protein